MKLNRRLYSSSGLIRPKCVTVGIIVLTALLFVAWKSRKPLTNGLPMMVNINFDEKSSDEQNSKEQISADQNSDDQNSDEQSSVLESEPTLSENNVCPNVNHFSGSVDTQKIYPTLNFSDSEWTNHPDYFWNSDLENRYLQINSTVVPSLKIVVVPHSHNDPGWGWTIEQYYSMRTANILNNLVKKLDQLKNMTFIWSEASYLEIWWKNSNQAQKDTFKKLIAEGRLEITTGGWVMTDEAVVHTYSMIDQLIEGQHWHKAYLNTLPTTSWSVDSFGFGSAFPYILKNSGMESMVILGFLLCKGVNSVHWFIVTERIHYAWKKWLAETQTGDFNWVQRWDSKEENSVLCHHVFYTMYLISNSLGPHSELCRRFEYTSLLKNPVTDENVREMSELFLSEGGRTASLFPHNIALAVLGADFAFQQENEWDKSYESFMKIFEYINSNREKYNAEVSFGTPSTYFKAVRERQSQFPTFTGDFHVYSDTETKSDHRTAYWSGYYSSRPYWKRMHREVESAVRSAEILFTAANALYNKEGLKTNKLSENFYPKLQVARRHLGLFAHHDAAPGVSAASVMADYGTKLLLALRNGFLVQAASMRKILNDFIPTKTELLPSYEIPPTFSADRTEEIYVTFNESDTKQIILFNSLGWKKDHYVTITVNTPYVEVTDEAGNYISAQLNPVFELKDKEVEISTSAFQLGFVVPLSPLTASLFTLQRQLDQSIHSAVRSEISHNLEVNQEQSVFTVGSLEAKESTFSIENKYIKLGFDVVSGFLRRIKKIDDDKEIIATMGFGAYLSVQGHSGPYLFRPQREKEKQVPPKDVEPKIFRIVGPISSEVLTYYETIQQTVRIHHTFKTIQHLQDAVFIENDVNVARSEGEYFMRIDTNLNSKAPNLKGEWMETFYTDQSGYTVEKRRKIEEIEIEGNYYPVTTMAYIEDISMDYRFSLIVDRAQAVSSFANGRLEAFIERRVLHDDNRGIGQGVTDNRRTVSKYILVLEKMFEFVNQNVSTPTIHAHHLSQGLNYPATLFRVNSAEPIKEKWKNFSIFNKEMPCDSHILNLRTVSNPLNPILASSEALLIVQKLGYACSSKFSTSCDESTTGAYFAKDTRFNDGIKPVLIRRTDLTGLRNYSSIYPKFKDTVNELGDIKIGSYEINTFSVTF